jgi:hypothetical protein
MAEVQRVPILIAEYSTLRAEVMAARDTFYKTLAVGIPAFLGLLGLINSKNSILPNKAIFFVAFFIAGYVIYITAFCEKNTRAFTARIREIEEDINRLIGGEELLVWETYFGWGSMLWPINKKAGKRPPRHLQ